MATFRIEEYLPGDDATREVLGSYTIPEGEPAKLAALLDVLSAEGRRAGGYSKLAVYLDDAPVNVFVNENDELEVIREAGPQHQEIADSKPVPAAEHTISIREYYPLPDGRRETFGLYHVPATDRRKAAAILEVASARRLRSGGYGEVAIYLDDRLMNASIDSHDELVLTPVDKASG